MIRTFGAVALGAVLLFPLLATARHVAVVDPNDTRGVLDIRRVSIVDTAPARWKITTFGRWNAADIWDRGLALVFLDTFGSPRADYYVIVSSEGDRLRGALYRDKARGRDPRISAMRVRHPRARVVNIIIPFSKLTRRDSGIFRWYAQTMLSGKGCRQFCIDRAPDDGSIVEPGGTDPVPTPTPTITITPTPTPSP